MAYIAEGSVMSGIFSIMEVMMQAYSQQVTGGLGYGRSWGRDSPLWKVLEGVNSFRCHYKR